MAQIPPLVDLSSSTNHKSQPIDLPHSWDSLNRLFRQGSPPPADLHGRFAGRFLAVQIAPLLTQLATTFAGAWMPWRGKLLNPGKQTGTNILRRDSKWFFRLVFPLYRHYLPDAPNTFLAFPFRTYPGEAMFDPGVQVLKLDYNHPPNPAWNVRRVLDELVELEPDLYLGKANFNWWWGSWQTTAFFSLARLA